MAPVRLRAGVFACARAAAMIVLLALPAGAAELSPATKDLFLAVHRNDLSAVRTSVSDGADISARNLSGLLAVDMAVENGFFEIAHYLLSLRETEHDTETPASETASTLPGVSEPAAPLTQQALDRGPSPAPEISQLADLPPGSPSVPPADIPDPFDPAAVPKGTAHPVIESSAGPGEPAIIEPPIPPAVPETANAAEPPPPAPEETVETTRPAPASRPSPKISEIAPSPPSPGPRLLNQLGNMLGLGVKANEDTDIPPPAAPDTGELERKAPPSERSGLLSREDAPPPALPKATPAQSMHDTPVEIISEDGSAAPDILETQTPPAEITASQPVARTDPVPDTLTDPVPASEETDGFVKTQMREVAEEFPQTFDTYLGGWFIKWMGQKMGLMEEPSEELPEDASEPAQFAELPSRRMASYGDTDALEPMPGLLKTNSAEVPEMPDSEPELGLEPESPSDETAVSDVLTPETRGTGASEQQAQALVRDPTADGSLAEAAALIFLEDEPISAGIPVTEPDDGSDAMQAEHVAGDSGPKVGAKIEEAVEMSDSGRTVLPEENRIDEGSSELAELADQPEFPSMADPEAEALTGLEEELAAGPPLETRQPAAVPEEEQLAELSDDLPNPNADPFAPEAVPPGTAHPVVGEKPPALPPPPAADDAETGDALADETLPGFEADADELDSLAADLGADTADTMDAGKIGAEDTGKEDMIDQLASFIEADDGPMADPGDLPPGLEEAPGETGELDALADTLEVTRTQTAMLPTAASRSVPNTVLTLGESIHLTALMPPEPDDPSEKNYCIEKNRGAVVFCVEPVDWPPDLVEELRVSSIMYQGAQAVVRYDEQQISRLHAIFPNEAFDTLISYYSRRFGEPTEITVNSIAPFAQPRQENPVMLWRRADPLSGEQTTLEIRKFDDSRGGFPDLKHGAIMLFNAKSGPIFPVLSSLDLMPTTGTN